MSEFREDLLASSIDKKRVVKIIVVAVLLITAFAFSIILSSLIFDTQRPYPSDQLSEAEEETGITLTLPPFPYNLSDFLDLNLTQDQLDSLLDALQDMFDGDIDDLDLGNFSQSQLALMASEIEVFRVFNYADFNSMSNKLWKYECFDEYTGDGWQSTAASQIYDFYTYEDYGTYHWDKEILRIKMPITPSIGINSMVIPSLFSTPFIMEGSISDNPAGNIDFMNPPVLYKDDFNSSILDVYFNSDVDVNMSYELFGLNLPTNDQINTSAIHASYTPLPIQNKFLQLPPTIQLYLSNNPFVYTHYLALNSTVLPNDNAFMVANKIRNYLQIYFSLPADPDTYTTAPPGRDAVDYFCETQEGMWVEFASAFVIFARIFGVSSRFVDGFNSLAIEEVLERGQDTFAIKYRNIYNWAEIFVPTDISGDGEWVQMDVIFDSYGVGGSPWNPEVIYNNNTNYNLTVTSNFKSGYRIGQNAKITATLSQYGAPVQGETITFFDLATDDIIGSADTDINGNASVFISIDNSQVVGPHYIVASQSPQINNFTRYDINGDLQVHLTNINPQSVNISISTFTNIQGYIVDPLNNLRVRNAQIELLLLNKGTNNRALPYSPNSGVTGQNGDFDMDVYVNLSISPGQYEVRVDFNNTFINPIVPISLDILPFVNNSSSNRMDFNVTKGERRIWFYIDDFPSEDRNSPIVNRFTDISLKAYVFHETYGPLSNQFVEFYDYTNGNFINSSYTNINGYATIDYFAGYQALSGPNLIYVKIGMQENYSYYILNDAPTIHLISGPYPREINRTGGGQMSFNIVGEITDTYDRLNKLGYSDITLKLLQGVTDYSGYLMPNEVYPYRTGSDGYFNLNFDVKDDTPTGNYTLRIDFNGTIDLNLQGNPYPDDSYFDLSILSNSTFLEYDIQISAPTTLKFDFWIDGFTVYDYYQPIINRNGDVNLSVYLEWGNPLDAQDIDFYDLTQDEFIGTIQTTNGRASLIYNTNASTVAGPHLIYARWGSNYNYSYFTLNDNITLDVQVGPSPNQIDRGGDTFTLQGTITDTLNGKPIKFTEIYIALFDGTMTDVSYYLSSNWFQLNDTGAFDLTLSVDSGTPAINFTINVGFYGGFIYSFPNNQFNEFNFYFDPFIYSNFTSNDNGNFELQVIDPNDVAIQFWVDGNPALSYYDDSNLPERYSPGDLINFSVYIIKGVTPVEFDTVVLRDIYIASQIGSYLYQSGDAGYAEFIINTSTWHAGLHKIEVQWSTYSTFNSTYVIINKTITISAYSSLHHIQRDFDIFSVFGSVQDGATNLRGLNIKILLLDSSNNDVSGYLNLAGSQTINVYDGSFQFDVNFISINCPQGQYYFRIDFNGSINEAGISLSNYMINTISILIPVNITAGTYITGNYDTLAVEDQFYEDDTLYAYGYLLWDNGTAISGKEVTITIKDNLGFTITSATGFTNGSGWFNISILIGNWPNDAEVWTSFIPEDNYIDPYYYYVDYTEIELFR